MKNSGQNLEFILLDKCTFQSLKDVDLEIVKCQRLLGPKFRKVKTSFFPEIRQVLNTLMPSEGVCDYTPV